MTMRYEDHLDLHELYCGLFRNLDEQKLTSLADQYHPDVVVRIYFSRQEREANKPNFTTNGCQQIIAEMTSFFTQVDATHHALSNFVTNVAGDEAFVRSSLRAYHRGTGKFDGLFEESLAAFDSKAHKGPDGDWKVIELNYTVSIVLGSPSVFGETFPEA